MKYRRFNAGPGERCVHNFPAAGRSFGHDGFRYWTENIVQADAEPDAAERVRCFCDFTAKAPVHFGTRAVITENGKRRMMLPC